MNYRYMHVIMIGTALLLLIISCKKKDDTAVPKTTSKGYVHFVAYESFTPDFMNTTTIINTHAASAYFYKSRSDIYNLLNAGDVHCNNEKLVFDPIGGNLFPYYQLSMPVPFVKSVLWSVTGSSSVDPFYYKLNIGFPYISEIKCLDTLRKNMDFKLSLDTLLNADSVQYFLDLNSSATVAGSIKSLTFSKNDIDFPQLMPGEVRSIRVEVTAYRHLDTVINNNTYYFQNLFNREINIVVKD